MNYKRGAPISRIVLCTFNQLKYIKHLLIQAVSPPMTMLKGYWTGWFLKLLFHFWIWALVFCFFFNFYVWLNFLKNVLLLKGFFKIIFLRTIVPAIHWTTTTPLPLFVFSALRSFSRKVNSEQNYHFVTFPIYREVISVFFSLLFSWSNLFGVERWGDGEGIKRWRRGNASNVEGAGMAQTTSWWRNDQTASREWFTEKRLEDGSNRKEVEMGSNDEGVDKGSNREGWWMAWTASSCEWLQRPGVGRGENVGTE